MRTKLRQRDSAEWIRTTAQGQGIASMVFLACGCMVARFQSGGKVQTRCKAHTYRRIKYRFAVAKWPKHCACGYVDRLTRESATAQRLGQDEKWADMRRLRLAHVEEGKCDG